MVVVVGNFLWVEWDLGDFRKCDWKGYLECMPHIWVPKNCGRNCGFFLFVFVFFKIFSWALFQYFSLGSCECHPFPRQIMGKWLGLSKLDLLRICIIF